jgi:DMSO/TMAO reductase YedYZ molybdopterin-dependent catalytic subunit
MTQPSAASDQPGHSSVLAGAVAGVLSAAVAMGIAQLVAGLFVPQSSPVFAVGQAAIDLTPEPVKNFAISTFGVDDKNVLLGGILLLLAVFAAAIGILAVRRLAFGLWGLAVFACIGLAAALTRPTADAGYAIPTLAGAAAGAYALTRLARAARALGAPASGTRRGGRTDRGSAGSRASGTTVMPLTPPDLPARTGAAEPVAAREPAGAVPVDSSFTFLPNPDDPGPPRWPARRRFLTATGLAVVTAGAAALIGRELITRHNVSAARAAIRFPKPAVPAPPLPPGSNLNIPGLSSFITPDGSFYRVDTALLLPEVDPATWQLRIHGMVQREVTLTFGELLRRPLIEDYVTLTCVSNPVGGPYVGNAKWLGARLADLISEARPLAGASQLLCTSVDGFTCGTPLQVVLDGRDALLAVAMNGQALPVAHGFPARMVVPGLYGYVSATKWVTDIEVTTFAAANAYWVQRGWAQRAPIKTESRIDVPAGGATLAPGRTPVAGVAWAQHKGIAAVEVRVDGGAWQEARLAAVPDIDTWRQWVWEWQATPGNHLLEARATDATGYTQTAMTAPPPPNGASGYPSAAVTVRSSLPRGIWLSAAGKLLRTRLRPGQQVAEPAAEQVRVAGPAGGHVIAVPDDEGGGVVGCGTASGQRDRSPDELAARVVQGRLDLVLDVSRIRAVVPAEPPGRRQIGRTFHVLRQAGCPPVRQDAAPGLRVAGARQDQHAVADRADRPVQ